jgi:hypothetical protein
MIYDDQGNPTFLGHRVEAWYGRRWIESIAYRFRLTETEASDLLEHGGTEKYPQDAMPMAVVSGLLARN